MAELPNDKALISSVFLIGTRTNSVLMTEECDYAGMDILRGYFELRSGDLKASGFNISKYLIQGIWH